MRSLLILLFLPLISSAQLTPTLLTTLDAGVDETSGLLFHNNMLWTHNDAGHAALLHQIGIADGSILRTIAITNAQNVDWEDLASDGSYIYIGDVGNNNGDRTDLKILRFPITQLDDPTVTEVEVEVIGFSYEDQTSFEPASNANNWDCEALIAKDDSLFLFTKNWVDQQTRIYALPAEPGTHSAQLRGSYDVQGMVTGASYSQMNNSIVLIGYTNGLFVPFLCTLSGFTGNSFFSGNVDRGSLSLSFVQTEGVEWNGAEEFYLSNETSPLSAARLWSLSFTTSVIEAPPDEGDLRVFPNPADDRFNVDRSIPIKGISIYDATGREILWSNSAEEMYVGSLANGTYQVLVNGDRCYRANLLIQR